MDRFVAAKLKEKALAAMGQADGLTLIRRVTYDLTGLPPTLEEIDRFLPEWQKDEVWLGKSWSMSCWRHRLLGKNLLAIGLTSARYAETHGYDKDKRG